MIPWIGRMIDRLFAVTGAVCFAQFPQFFLQYLHELSGHIAELRYQVSLIEHAALLSNKSVQQLVTKFLENSDPDFVLQGQMMKEMTSRLEFFQTGLKALLDSDPFARPFIFIRYADKQIVYDTIHQFQWGFSFSIEGVIYALIGLFCGYLFFQSLRFLFQSIKRVFSR